MNLRQLITSSVLFFSLVCAHAELPKEESILKKGGSDAAVIISKARDILTSTRVFASRAIGESGEPTASCWALTVIVRYDPDAKEFLNRLIDSSEMPERKLYAIVGLLELDPLSKERFSREVAKELPEQPVHVQHGCLGSVSTYGIELYTRLENGTGSYLFDDLPSLFQTVEVTRFTER